MTFPLIPTGTVCTVAFDERGLCEVIDNEVVIDPDNRDAVLSDNPPRMYEVRYLDDDNRRSKHVKTGDTEWHHPLDLSPVLITGLNTTRPNDPRDF